MCDQTQCVTNCANMLNMWSPWSECKPVLNMWNEVIAHRFRNRTNSNAVIADLVEHCPVQDSHICASNETLNQTNVSYFLVID